MVLMMDANDDATKGVMCRQLRNGDIGMQEVVHAAVEGKGLNTHFKGLESIDGIWVTKEIEVLCASYLPYDAELGDHRPVIVNIAKRSLIGKDGHRVQNMACHRLHSKVECNRQEYIDRLEQQIQHHNFLNTCRRKQTENLGRQLQRCWSDWTGKSSR